MYRLYGIPTQNTLKCAYVLAEVGKDFEYKQIDLRSGEQKTEAFLKINPVGKVPALQHNDFNLFESGAICRYIANVEKSPLYPTASEKRALVDQWLDFFSAHLGRWLSTLFFENVIKKWGNRGEPNVAVCTEATEFATQQFQIVEKHLSKNTFFAGDTMTIADLCAFAYIDQVTAIAFDISNYPNVQKWREKIGKLPSIQTANNKIRQ